MIARVRQIDLNGVSCLVGKNNKTEKCKIASWTWRYAICLTYVQMKLSFLLNKFGIFGCLFSTIVHVLQQHDD